MKANTWNSYSVHLCSPVTSLVKVELFSIVKIVSASAAELFLLYKSLNPVITPCLEPAGGNFQDALTVVEDSGNTVKLPGAWLGAKNK